MIALLALLLAAQSGPTTPVQPIVKGTGLAPTESSEEAVLASVQRVFGGIERSDAASIRAELRPNGGATAVTDKGVRHYGWDEWLTHIRADGHRYREAFVGRPAVEVDGDIAMVWGEYRFTVDGAPHHCGVDHVDLVRESGTWRIQNITWTQRPCN